MSKQLLSKQVLIDTHIFLWILKRPEKIPEKFLGYLQSSSYKFYLSSISISELFIKSSLDKLDLDFDPVVMAKKAGLHLIDFSADDAKALLELPFYHKDPFDRMLISQALNRNFSVMSLDSKFSFYPCQLL